MTAAEEKENRERYIRNLRTDYTVLANCVCNGLVEVPLGNEELRERMDKVEQDLRDANALPEDWESWRTYLVLFKQLWDHVKGTCTS
jgi:hypothetical protein